MSENVCLKTSTESQLNLVLCVNSRPETGFRMDYHLSENTESALRAGETGKNRESFLRSLLCKANDNLKHVIS